jgi:hypothetical protein
MRTNEESLSQYMRLCSNQRMNILSASTISFWKTELAAKHDRSEMRGPGEACDRHTYGPPYRRFWKHKSQRNVKKTPGRVVNSHNELVALVLEPFLVPAPDEYGPFPCKLK